MGLSRKEINASKEELKALIDRTTDENLKKDYLFYLYQINYINDINENNNDNESYSKKLRELEMIYQENKDLYQINIDYHNNISSEKEKILFISDNYDTLKKTFPNYHFNKKQSIAFARNFYENLDSHFLEIVDQILDKKTLTIKKQFNRNYEGINYFIGGINKNYINIVKKNDYTDYFTLIHEFGHAINNIYNPKSYYEFNYFDEVVSLFMELIATYEGRDLFNENLITYENADNFIFYYKFIKDFKDQYDIINIMYLNQFNKFNKPFVKEIENNLNIKKKELKSILNTSLFRDGNYPISYIMALELLYIYKHNKKEALELLKELMYKLPLNNQVKELSKILPLNVHAMDETKEVIEKAHHVLKKTR